MRHGRASVRTVTPSGTKSILAGLDGDSNHLPRRECANEVDAPGDRPLLWPERQRFLFRRQACSMRIGIFGGTFDPVHLGHLIVAEQCREQGRLDEVCFIPAARPPHKQERSVTPFAQRLEMLALAVAGQPAFRVEDLEDHRPGPSYTADTLEELRRSRPDAEFLLIVGTDTLEDLPHWVDPVRIIRQA